MSHKRVLISNFSWLTGLQIARFILPLITFPYLVRVLGVEKYGLISFASAFVGYFLVLTEYGFKYSATKNISIHRNEPKAVSEIFCSTMIIKFSLCLVSILLLTIIVFSFSKFTLNWEIYFISFGVVVGDLLFPVWFFQGMEKMKYISLLSILSRLIFTVSIFILVRGEEDYLIVPMLTCLSIITSGIISQVIIWKYFNVKIIFPSKESILKELTDGFHLFLSRISVNIYTISNPFLLGLLTNNTMVGYYSAGEKIVKATMIPFSVLSQTIYPHMNKLASESKEQLLALGRKLIRVVTIPAIFISCVLIFFSSQISAIILGPQYIESIIVIQILSFLPLIVGLNNIFGMQTMIPLGYTRAFLKTLSSAAVLNIILCFILIPLFQHVGTAIALVITELWVTTTQLIVLHLNGVRLFSAKKLFSLGS